jgi:hypothetical protein
MFGLIIIVARQNESHGFFARLRIQWKVIFSRSLRRGVARMHALFLVGFDPAISCCECCGRCAGVKYLTRFGAY